jgi:hypothetical protein
MFNYIKATKEDITHMSANNTQTIKWYVDLSFAVHKNMKSHTRAIMTIGNRFSISKSTKQKVNARSSMESEMITVDNSISKILWTKRFVEAKGYMINANIVYQNTTSAIKLKISGIVSSGTRIRHFDI